MKMRFVLIGFSIFVIVLFASCQRDHVDVFKSFSIEEDESYLMSNLNVVSIVTNRKKVLIVRKGHNIKSGNAFCGPWEELEASSGAERYLISDKNAGNNGLYVNGVILQSGIGCKGIVIKFGEGILNDQVAEQKTETAKSPIPLMN